MVPVLVVDRANRVSPHLELVGYVRRIKVYRKKSRENGCTKTPDVQLSQSQTEIPLTQGGYHVPPLSPIKGVHYDSVT